MREDNRKENKEVTIQDLIYKILETQKDSEVEHNSQDDTNEEYEIHIETSMCDCEDCMCQDDECEDEAYEECTCIGEYEDECGCDDVLIEDGDIVLEEIPSRQYKVYGTTYEFKGEINEDVVNLVMECDESPEGLSLQMSLEEAEALTLLLNKLFSINE